MKRFSKTLQKSTILICAVILALSITISVLATNMNFDSASAILSSSGKYFNSDYATRQDLKNDAMLTSEQVMQEGVVLLKGDEAPLKKSGNKVTIFGNNSITPVYNGTGSSGGTTNPVNPYTAFESKGITYNPTMKGFYEDATKSGMVRNALGGLGKFGDILSGCPVCESKAVGDVNYGGAA